MKKISPTLLVFALMNFVILMTGVAFNGILDKVALTLNISVANSGLLNSMYSYGAAFGVPITLILFRKFERVRLLKITLLITILMTIAIVFTQNFEQLLIVRLVMGISANSYGVLATAMVVSLSSKERQGRSMAFYIMGASLSLVVGVPLTRVLSSAFEWQSIFWILSIIMIFSLIYFIVCLPKGEHASENLNLRNELQFFKDGRTLLIIIYTLIMFVGYNGFYTFVTPYLLQLFPSTEAVMSIILVFIGISSFLGNMIGGHVSDRIGYAKSMLLGAVLQMVSVLLIILFQPVKWLCIFFVMLLVMSAWFAGLQLNTGIAQATHNKSSFMLSINSSALQLGSAMGSSLAAAVISLSKIENIVYITLLANLIICIIQIYSNKKYS